MDTWPFTWASDYFIGQTVVISNPKGYPVENANGFREDLIIKLTYYYEKQARKGNPQANAG